MAELPLGDIPLAEARWRALAETAVGGGFGALRSETDDGLPIEPLYPRATTEGPRPWRASEAWAVSARLDHPDPAAANRAALLDLEGGADALTLVFAGSPFGRGLGLAPRAIDAALADVELDLISGRLDAGVRTPEAAACLADIVVQRRLTSAGLRFDLGFDPIGIAATTGQPCSMADLGSVLDAASSGGFSGCPLMADGRAYHEAGAGETQELAAVLATGVAYLRHLAAAGLDLAAARTAIAFLLPADADVFVGIAKMRALRRLWARVEAACDLEPSPLRLHAETSWRMMTRYDPWTNTMRATAAAMAAGLGGADAITVLPMTLPLGLPDDAARRLARNVGRILIDEANLAKVEDPAAGSGGIEALTESLCERAWALFQEIEREGGIEAALHSGSLRGQIAATAAKRRGDLATLKNGLVGTSRFANLSAPSHRVLDVHRRPDPARSEGALPSLRDAAPFEALRDRAEANAATGVRPAVNLATLGTTAASSARATEAVNFLATAGIAAVVATADQAATTASANAGAARVACLCGTDAAYIEHGEFALAALRRSGARYVAMVGGDEAWLQKGADALITDGVDALQLLETILDVLTREP